MYSMASMSSPLLPPFPFTFPLKERDINLLRDEREHLESLHAARLHDIESELESIRLERDEAYRDVLSLTGELNAAEANLSKKQKEQAQLTKEKKVVSSFVVSVSLS
jgi:hypothetical protein